MTVVGLRDTVHAVRDDLCAVFGYGLAVAVVGQRGAGGNVYMSHLCLSGKQELKYVASLSKSVIQELKYVASLSKSFILKLESVASLSFYCETSLSCKRKDDSYCLFCTYLE